MKLDDRFMTIFTVLVLIIGAGAIMNRGDGSGSLLGGSGAYKAQPDVFTLRAGRVQSLDVLLNDYNADRVNPDELKIVNAPSCGSALVVAGTIQFSESHACEGQVLMQYCVPFEDACEVTVVTLNVLKVENIPAAVSSNGKGEPMIMADVTQGNSPTGFANETSSMQVPVRLEVPSTAEVTTPTEAVAEIRNRDVQVAVATDIGDMGQSDRAVSVDNSTARVSRVGGGDVALQAPALEGEESNINIAGATTSRPNVSAPRPSAPTGFGAGTQGLETAMSLPSSPSLPSQGGSSPQPPVAPTQIAAADTRPATPVSPQVEATPVVETPVASVEAVEITPTGKSSDVVATADIGIFEEVPGPVVAETPNDSGVIANLARSNSFLGVTVSAAKGLLSPEEGSEAAARADTSTSRPNTGEFAVAGGVAPDGTAVIDSARSIPLPQIDRRFAPEGEEPEQIVASLDSSRHNEVVFKRISRPAQRPVQLNTDDVAVDGRPQSGIQIISEPAQVASLNVEEPQPTRPVEVPVTAGCGIDMSLQTSHGDGTEIVATVVSPCRPGQQFAVGHAGLKFSAETDADGVANFVVPAMVGDAEVAVMFADGANQSQSIQVPNMDRVTRVAVMWSADIDLDLHAREFGAQAGTIGHIWAQRPSDPQKARRAGGGYLTVLGPQNGPGLKAEVYTIIKSSRTQSGLVDLSLQLAGVGQQCENRPEIHTMRSEGARVGRDRDLQFTISDCANAAGTVIRNAVQDIRIARR
ncbi:hypothetical protein [Halovulum sp. GXIMD14793]